MLQVGIFNGYFPYALEEQAKKIKSIGFNTVQLDLAFKDVDFSTPDSINLEKAKRIRETFRDYNLPISGISGYTNIVHPDSAKRKEKLDYLKALIKSARHFGTPYVISETGTFNPKSDWVSDPKNKTEDFEAHNIDRMDHVLKQIFDTLTTKIRIAHAKDVKRSGTDKGEKHADIEASESHTFRGVGEIELPAPGLGSLNYDYYLERLAEKHPNIPIVIEHLEESDVPRAKKFLDGKLRALGL